MNKIEKLIQELCPNGVEWKKLGDLCKISTGKGITKKDEVEGGEYPIISGGINPMGFFHSCNRKANTITVSRVGANAGFVNFIKRDFYLNDKCFSVVPSDTTADMINVIFLYYFLKYRESIISELQSEGGVPTINTQKLSSIEIPLPPLPVQTEIVRILDKFVEQQEQLEKLIELRKKQYEYYREEMLTAKEGWETVTIGDLCTITRGRRFVRDDVRSSGMPCIHYGDMYTYYGITARTTKTFLDRDFPKKMQYAKKGDVVVVGAGENDLDIGVGTVWEGDEPAAVHDACYILEHKQNSKYIAYFLRTNNYHQQLRKYVSEGKICSISGTGLGSVYIPVPTLKRQQEIADALDNFESSIAELTFTLEASKKRYSHYRDQLLNF